MKQKTKDLITDYHNLIYAYLFRNGYDEDVYFPLAEITVEVADKYNENYNTKFSSYLWRCFINGMARENAKERAKKRNELLSLDNSVCLLYPAPLDVEETVINKIFIEDFIDSLPERQRKEITLLYFGFTRDVIAKKIGVSRRTVQNDVMKIKNKFNEVKNNV
mgnify:CR=1 FL=1